MSDPIDAILIGAGQRGAEVYGAYALQHPGQLRFAAVAEPDPDRRARFAGRHGLPAGACFPSWEPLLARPQMARVAVICTQDQGHHAPAMAAILAGYDVLLEKPMATTPEGCRQLVSAARQGGLGAGGRLHGAPASGGRVRPGRQPAGPGGAPAGLRRRSGPPGAAHAGSRRPGRGLMIDWWGCPFGLEPRP